MIYLINDIRSATALIEFPIPALTFPFPALLIQRVNIRYPLFWKAWKCPSEFDRCFGIVWDRGRILESAQGKLFIVC